MMYLYKAAQRPLPSKTKVLTVLSFLKKLILKCIDEGLVRLSDRALVFLPISEKISLPTTGISL